jgi:glycosyltransferase involved in cell wall biosynthesis
MARAIEDLLNHEKHREKMIQKRKKQAASYSWQRMAEQTLEVYKQALGEK